MRLELEIAQHVGAQLMHDMRTGRNLESRRELACERGAPALVLRMRYTDEALRGDTARIGV